MSVTLKFLVDEDNVVCQGNGKDRGATCRYKEEEEGRGGREEERGRKGGGRGGRRERGRKRRRGGEGEEKGERRRREGRRGEGGRKQGEEEGVNRRQTRLTMSSNAMRWRATPVTGSPASRRLRRLAPRSCGEASGAATSTVSCLP